VKSQDGNGAFGRGGDIRSSIIVLLSFAAKLLVTLKMTVPLQLFG
jgi:hypothetical protein